MVREFSILSILSWLLLSPAFALGEKKAGGEIPTGKWIGFLKAEGNVDAVALSLDTFLVKPDSIKESPHLEMVFKLGLGGYLSTEYETEIFQEIQYDGDQGLLTLDEPRNELRLNAFVYSEPFTHMEGSVFFRSASVTAALYLEYQTDEPNEGSTVVIPPFMPALSGQYEGVCGEEKAVLQIETAKGLTSELPIPSTGLHHYLITGAVGVENGLCPSVNPVDRPQWCVDHAYSSASYDFIQGKLYLAGTLETDECTRVKDSFECRMQFLSKNAGGLKEELCRFRKVRNKIAPFVVFPRRYHIEASAEQLLPLPLPDPPISRELVAAGNGILHGYLHHEATDRYQPLRLDVNATTSSDNPMHNLNNVFVSVAAQLFFGREISQENWVHQFDRQTLNIVPGYMLASAESDTLLQVTSWTRGFISGVWFSKAFGRVGTFEVRKGLALPTIPPGAKMVTGVAGHFRGPDEFGGTDYWDLRFLTPRQPRFPDKSYVLFQGNYQLFTGAMAWPIRRILRGSYDIYSGAVAWMENNSNGEAKLITGFVEDNTVKLFWPSDRSWAVGVFDRTFGSHRRRGDLGGDKK
ncbi:MAG: hypothetical protein HYR96_09610 [Deltaproteobacteria bacterium]|nr:hypothetical protein [Deltaproteobacteria bacterium]